jgi:PEGA domain-containing protein
VAAGQVAAVRVNWPNGTLAINAVPWAEVFVDGMPVGETPIGSIQVAIGVHEVVFRHPQLGERRATVTVTAGSPARVSFDLRSK